MLSLAAEVSSWLNSLICHDLTTTSSLMLQVAFWTDAELRLMTFFSFFFLFFLAYSLLNKGLSQIFQYVSVHGQLLPIKAYGSFNIDCPSHLWPSPSFFTKPRSTILYFMVPLVKFIFLRMDIYVLGHVNGHSSLSDSGICFLVFQRYIKHVYFDGSPGLWKLININFCHSHD